MCRLDTLHHRTGLRCALSEWYFVYAQFVGPGQPQLCSGTGVPCDFFWLRCGHKKMPLYIWHWASQGRFVYDMNRNIYYLRL